MHTNIELSLKPQFYVFLCCRELYFFKYAFSSMTLKILNPRNKSSFSLFWHGINNFAKIVKERLGLNLFQLSNGDFIFSLHAYSSCKPELRAGCPNLGHVTLYVECKNKELAWPRSYQSRNKTIELIYDLD